MFEFDESKSTANKVKHGIDFIEAQELWDDPDLLEAQARTEDEPRFFVFGRIGSKNWTAVITYREATVRIISVRRSREKEVHWYESERA